MSSKLTITRGTTYNLTFYYQDSTGAALSLTGATVFFTVKSAEYDTDATDTTALIEKTVTSHTDAAGGISTIALTPTDTYVTPGNYYYDIRVKDVDGNIYKMIEGRVVIDGSPTNRTS